MKTWLRYCKWKSVSLASASRMAPVIYPCCTSLTHRAAIYRLRIYPCIGNIYIETMDDVSVLLRGHLWGQQIVNKEDPFNSLKKQFPRKGISIPFTFSDVYIKMIFDISVGLMYRLPYSRSFFKKTHRGLVFSLVCVCTSPSIWYFIVKNPHRGLIFPSLHMYKFNSRCSA